MKSKMSQGLLSGTGPPLRSVTEGSWVNLREKLQELPPQMPRETEWFDQNSPHWTLWQRSCQNGTNKNCGKQGSAASRPICTGLSCLGRARTAQLLPSWRVDLLCRAWPRRFRRVPSRPALVVRERDGLEDVLVSHEGPEVTFQNASLKETDRGCFCSEVGFMQFGVSRELQLRLSAVAATGKSPPGKGRISSQRGDPAGAGCVTEPGPSPGGREGDSPVPCGAPRGLQGERAPCWSPGGLPRVSLH